MGKGHPAEHDGFWPVLYIPDEPRARNERLGAAVRKALEGAGQSMGEFDFDLLRRRLRHSESFLYEQCHTEAARVVGGVIDQLEAEEAASVPR